MKCLSEIFPIWNHLYFLKKTYITHQIQFSFARRVGSQTLFMWQSYYKSKPILLISGVQPNLPCWQELRNIWGRKLSQWIFIRISSEQHGMGPGEQQNQEFFDAVEVSAHLLGVEPAASPLQNISNRTLVPNPAPCAPKSPPCSSHSPLHRYSHTLFALWAVPSRNLGMSSRIRGMNASSV